ncbi:alpha/beta fold hydrolase [Flavobacterium amniphilum]|uniref:alpha/beta fold hydrolase n=1 Tax=Flavobacterium amniphilum TaxID=1834035 RepID=UPI002029F2B9|nr:alpha/beta fold hydrolase [Flavobacterium amniphilum]MCL9805504.1 alpha/beta fold hydrolase [Flavobacterium amniphilum]
MKSFFKNSLFLVLLLFINGKTNAQEENISYVTTDDNVKLYTKKSGNGPLCIFIHGGPGAWSKSFEDMCGRNLEQHLTMVYYDQRGCGRSEGSKDDNYSLARMLKDIETIRIQNNTEEVYLLAHSFGGILATQYALTYPTHTKGVILANCTLNLKYSIANQVQYMNELMGIKDSTADPTLLSTLIQTRNTFEKKGMVHKLLSDNKENIDLLHGIDSKNPGNYSFAQKSFGIEDYLKDHTLITNTIKTPVLVITGKKDHAIGEKHYRSFLFPNQTVVKINGGHIVYYEQNEKFCKSVFNFISKTNSN